MASALGDPDSRPAASLMIYSTLNQSPDDHRLIYDGTPISHNDDRTVSATAGAIDLRPAIKGFTRSLQDRTG